MTSKAVLYDSSQSSINRDVVCLLLEVSSISYEFVPTNAVTFLTTRSLPMPSLPLLELDGLQLVQTGAILRYIARRANQRRTLYPFSVNDQYLCDLLTDSSEIMRGRLASIRGAKDIHSVSMYLSSIQRLIHGSYFTGDSSCYADYVIFHLLYSVEDLFPTTLEKYPRLFEFYERIASEAKVNQYMKRLSKRTPAEEIKKLNLQVRRLEFEVQKANQRVPKRSELSVEGITDELQKKITVLLDHEKNLHQRSLETLKSREAEIQGIERDRIDLQRQRDELIGTLKLCEQLEAQQKVTTLTLEEAKEDIIELERDNTVLKEELKFMSDRHEREKKNMKMDLEDLYKHLRLLETIVQHQIPPSDLKRLEETARWEESMKQWILET